MDAASNILAACDSSSSSSASNATAVMLKCVTEKLVERDEADQVFSRTIYLTYSAALVFFMQAGFAMLCAGK